ncbi:MAG: manganese efflux pump MntP family protein [Clostridia bacterium]|nr:manganese efflux pump MntP family protein [Clostridia bacterium]
MELGFSFFFTNIMLGVGLAMDAFSVSLANGLNEPCMKPRKMGGIAGVFAVFQGLMPMTGWLCVHTVVQYFSAFEKLVPWIALALLGWIGGKMIWDSVKGEQEECDKRPISVRLLLVQGVATSIDALSVGFTIAEYNALQALLAVSLIAAVTFVICYAGLMIGKKAGTRLAGKAGILGGVILIAIGIEILLTSLL